MGSIGASKTKGENTRNIAVVRKANDLTNVDTNTALKIINNTNDMRQKFINSLTTRDNFGLTFSPNHTMYIVKNEGNSYTVQENTLDNQRTFDTNERAIKRYISNATKLKRKK